MKRVAFCTFGCRLNQYDTETIRTLLTEQGDYQVVPLQDGADVYVVNTCSVTARADANARKAIRRVHGKHPEAAIVVTGCYAQRAPDELARYIAFKGSVCVDGVSLTVNSVKGAEFTLNIVLHTLEETTLAAWREGQQVNLEVDLIARYLERLLQGDAAAQPAGSSTMTREILERSGFAGNRD